MKNEKWAKKTEEKKGIIFLVSVEGQSPTTTKQKQEKGIMKNEIKIYIIRIEKMKKKNFSG